MRWWSWSRKGALGNNSPHSFHICLTSTATIREGHGLCPGRGTAGPCCFLRVLDGQTRQGHLPGLNGPGQHSGQRLLHLNQERSNLRNPAYWWQLASLWVLSSYEGKAQHKPPFNNKTRSLIVNNGAARNLDSYQLPGVHQPHPQGCCIYDHRITVLP